MRHTTIPLFALAFSLHLSALFATEVTIYPYTSQNVDGKPLVIEEYVTGETLVRPRKWTFAGATYEKRTVWDIPVETNAILEAWVDMNGNGEFDVDEPYGTNAGRDYPEIELSDSSYEMARIDLLNDTASPLRTRDGVISSMSPYERNYYTNFFNGKFIEDKALGQGGRVRIVRWLINNIPVIMAGSNARVVFDRRIRTGIRSRLTEADVLSEPGRIDIEELEHFYDEVVHNGDVREICGNVTNVSYMVVVGEGDASWADYHSSNTVYALQSVITRNFNPMWDQPIPLVPDVRDGRVFTRWKPPHDTGDFAAYVIDMTNTTAHSQESAMIKRPAKDSRGVMTWMFSNLPSGEWAWKIRGIDSKFSDQSIKTIGYTNGIPFSVP